MIHTEVSPKAVVAVLLFCLSTGVAVAEHVVLISIDGLAAYHLNNPELELPNIRALVGRGVWAESGRTVFPSVTHPSHATIITGVSPRIHGVLNNRMTNRLSGESFHVSEKSRAQSIEVPTLFDAAKKKGLTTMAMFWPETKGDPSVDFNVAHEHQPPRYDGQGRLDPVIARSEFLSELRSAGVPIDLYFRWYGDFALNGARDIILANATSYVIRKYRPQLVATLISVTDSTQHRFGSDHYLSQAALTTADHCVGMLREAVKAAGIEEKTTFIITADHGFHSVEHEVNVYPLLSAAGLTGRVTLHQGGWNMYVELGENFDTGSDGPALKRFLSRAENLRGVARIIPPEEFHQLGTRRYEEDPRVAGQYLLVADIDTHLVSDLSNTSTDRYRKPIPSHGHGYLPSHPRMYPAFVISGHGVRTGKRIGPVRNHDIAPTIAHILDLDLKGVEGRVLEEALVE